MKIAFDVDGVVLRSIDLILDHINRCTGRNLRPEELAGWDLEALGLDLHTLREAVDYMYSKPHIETYAGAAEVLSRIHTVTGEPLLFITGRASPETAVRQLEALPWNGTVPEMIVTGGNRDKRKYLAESSADFIVEDDPAYFDAYIAEGCGVGLMVRPWNSDVDVPVTARFQGWQEVDKWFSTAWAQRGVS
jgi:hypothetical protein